MNGKRQAIQLEASGLDVRFRLDFVAIGEKKRIQTLILRRGRQCCEEQEQQRASDASPPESRDLHPTAAGAGTHARKNNLAERARTSI